MDKSKLKQQILGLIEEKATEIGLDPALLKAIVQVESSFNPKAIRQEPRLRDASYGLMQILGNTAREVGFEGPFDDLYKPEVNLTYGAKYLKKQLDRYGGDVNKAAAAYNAGSARMRGGKFVNQGYVDKVQKYIGNYLAEVAPALPSLPTPTQLVPPAPPSPKEMGFLDTLAKIFKR